MTKITILSVLLAALAASAPAPSAQPESPEHVAWVATVLEHIEAIKPGMTRADLFKVFKLDGGLQQPPVHGRYVSRECPYFKVEVEFKTARPLERDAAGRLTETSFWAGGDTRDIITKISLPYVQRPAID